MTWGKTAIIGIAGSFFGGIIASVLGLEDLFATLIQVGSAETMLDDSKRFYDKAKKANVNAKLEIWEDMFHGWHSNAHILKDAEDAIINIGEFCRNLFDL